MVDFTQQMAQMLNQARPSMPSGYGRPGSVPTSGRTRKPQDNTPGISQELTDIAFRRYMYNLDPATLSERAEAGYKGWSAVPDEERRERLKSPEVQAVFRKFNEANPTLFTDAARQWGDPTLSGMLDYIKPVRPQAETQKRGEAKLPYTEGQTYRGKEVDIRTGEAQADEIGARSGLLRTQTTNIQTMMGVNVMKTLTEIDKTLQEIKNLGPAGKVLAERASYLRASRDQLQQSMDQTDKLFATTQRGAEADVRLTEARATTEESALPSFLDNQRAKLRQMKAQTALLGPEGDKIRKQIETMESDLVTAIQERDRVKTREPLVRDKMMAETDQTRQNIELMQSTQLYRMQSIDESRAQVAHMQRADELARRKFIAESSDENEKQVLEQHNTAVKQIADKHKTNLTDTDPEYGYDLISATRSLEESFGPATVKDVDGVEHSIPAILTKESGMYEVNRALWTAYQIFRGQRNAEDDGGGDTYKLRQLADEALALYNKVYKPVDELRSIIPELGSYRNAQLIAQRLMVYMRHYAYIDQLNDETALQYKQAIIPLEDTTTEKEIFKEPGFFSSIFGKKNVEKSKSAVDRATGTRR